MDSGYTLTLPNGVSATRALARYGWRHELIRKIQNAVSTGYTNTLSYTYDNTARRIAHNDDTFGYNARPEVTSANVNTVAYAYAYDNIGNHTTSSANSASTTYTANNLNQYTAIFCAPAPPREPTYDLDGNMISNGDWAYTWDAENRLVAAYSNSVCVVSNAYDYMSRRVMKVTPEATHTFVCDGWNLIQETVATVWGVTTNTYIWGKDLSGTMQGLPAATGTAQAGAGGVGGLLAVSLVGDWYFPFYDAIGNVTAYIDNHGAVVTEYIYDAFGNTISSSGSLAETFCFRCQA